MPHFYSLLRSTLIVSLCVALTCSLGAPISAVAQADGQSDFPGVGGSYALPEGRVAPPPTLHRQATESDRVQIGAADVGPLDVRITSPRSGDTVDDDSVLVSGTFRGALNTGITVNGTIAHVDGSRFFAVVPLRDGTNTIRVTAASAEGEKRSQIVSINSTGTPDVQLRVLNSHGMPPLTASFIISGNGKNRIRRVEMRQDGSPALGTTDPAGRFEITYDRPGVYKAVFSVTDDRNITHTKSAFIFVSDHETMKQKAEAIWSNVTSALRAGDVGRAAADIHPHERSKYTSIFRQLQAHMSGIVDSFSSLQQVSLSPKVGEFAVNRNVDGVNRIFFINFVQDADGVWRLASM